PGLLFVDTPGHEAFTNLRRRGGALADLAILVVDVTEGFKPQSLESLDHLKRNETPFVLAANKVDLLPGWNPTEGACFADTFPNQNSRVQEELDKKIYELVGELHDYGFQAERFDRIEKFEKQIGIIPTSAKTGEGVPELLAILTGLAQRFLKKELSVEAKGPGRGSVLELKKERGLGKTADVIIYDGTLEKGDKIAIGGLDNVKVTKVRALLKPKPLDEIRDPQDKFRHVNKVSAAAGVKIASPDLEGVIAGAPVWVIESDEEAKELQERVKEELESLRIQSDVTGLVVKADTIGSLEALESQLRGEDIPIRRADVGEVSRRDVVEASTVYEEDSTLAVILAFNVGILSHAEEEAKNRKVKVLTNDVIYRLIEDYQEWAEKEKERIRKEKLEEFIRPGKFAIKQGYVFRSCDPAIVGVDVLGGILKPGYPVMRKDGDRIGTIKEIQEEQNNLSKAEAGDELALSIEGPIVGRHIKEGDVLYVDVPRNHMIELKRDLKDMISEDEIGIMKEIIDIKQKEDPTYGVM
ncbi:MAG: translation initiation factor IF-2, partial [Hadesarchaea archaeon]|nr:translation initiation factor IF-2 [Hadesarchaea archaeon]